MFSRVLLGADGRMADAHHLLGALAVTVAVVACAEVARMVRWALVPLGLGLVAAAFLHAGDGLAQWVTVAAGVALAALSIPRGPVRNRYGNWPGGKTGAPSGRTA